MEAPAPGLTPGWIVPMPEAVGDAITLAIWLKRTTRRGTGRSHSHPEMRQARMDLDAGLVPIMAYEPYTAQFYRARNRGIAFQFTIVEWWEWWQTDDRWRHRGVKGNGLVMARIGDVGPYSPSNVYCTTTAGNIRDMDPTKRSERHKETWRRFKEAGGVSHLAVRGDGHPWSKAVITPSGRFGSCRLAAEFFRVDPRTAQRWARDGKNGWRLGDA